MNDIADTPTNQFADPCLVPTDPTDPAAQLRAYALAEADAEAKRAEMLWAEFKRIEDDVQPHIERMERARKTWCEAHSKAMQLREMFGGAK